ncbi:MAG: class I SAM-dependent methyltransferase [Chloroflexi bacterium]|nr:class I SAM-dependent methyltransferase [Chloroflexota bacterium]
MNAHEVRQLAHAEESYWWHRGRQRIVKRVLSRYVPSGSRILDVGCGPGGTTQSYAGNGRVLAADASPESTRIARSRGLTVATMEATHLAVRPGSCDAIVSLDLIEHIDDDERALREMYDALRPGGALVVTVPAYQFLWSSHDVAVGHKRRYTKGQLVRLAKRAGFEIELAAYAMSSIFPAAMAIRLAERLRPKREHPQANFVKLPRVANALLERIVGLGPQPLRFVPVPFGLSIVLVGRRPADG